MRFLRCVFYIPPTYSASVECLNHRPTPHTNLISSQPQETAQLEAKAFELEQQTTFVAEAKSVLDSWIRYEAQVKQRQQRELAETLIAKVKKELETPANLQKILQQSVQDVESTFLYPLWFKLFTDGVGHYRNYRQGLSYGVE